MPCFPKSALSAAGGAWGVRVHDVAASRDAVAVAAAWRDGGDRALRSGAAAVTKGLTDG